MADAAAGRVICRSPCDALVARLRHTIKPSNGGVKRGGPTDVTDSAVRPATVACSNLTAYGISPRLMKLPSSFRRLTGQAVLRFVGAHLDNQEEGRERSHEQPAAEQA